MKWWVPVLMGTALLGSCQAERSDLSSAGPRYLTLSGVPESAATLELVLALDGKPATSRPLHELSRELVQQKSKISVDLGLTQTAGKLFVGVGAFDQSGRLVAAGSAEQQLEEQAPAVALSTDVPPLLRAGGGPLLGELRAAAGTRRTQTGTPLLPSEGGTPLTLRGFGFLPGDQIELCAGPAPMQRCVPAQQVEWKGLLEVALQAPALPGAFGQPIAVRVQAADGARAERAGLLSYFERMIRLEAVAPRALRLPNTALPNGGGSWLTMEDFDGDGDLDIAVNTSQINGAKPTLQLFWNEGDGLFAGEPTVYEQPSSALPGAVISTLLSADLNGDGRPDLAQLESENGSLERFRLALYFNKPDRPQGPFSEIKDGEPTFHHADVVLPLENAYRVGLADLNGDGRKDLIASIETASLKSGGLRLFLSAADRPGTFNLVGDADCALQGLQRGLAYALPTLDLNHDHKDDIVTDASLYPETGKVVTDLDGPPAVQVVLSGEGGRCTAVRRQALQGEETSVLLSAAGDADGDGNEDVFLISRKQGARLLLGDGKGSFGRVQDLATPGELPAWLGEGNSPAQSASADFNGDGLPDLAIPVIGGGASPESTKSQLLLLLNQGGGRLPGAGAAGRLTMPTGLSGSRLGTGDLNGDNRPDLVVFSTVSRELYIFMNRPEVQP